MAKKQVTDVLDGTGLRFTSKAVGSPFSSASSFHKPTMSCFKCGKHSTRDGLENRKLLGASRTVCKTSCASRT